MARRRSLVLEGLEDRRLPALFGIPWSDARHLSVSFAPDGTAIAGHPSTLFAALDGQMPSAVWQREILRAIQTWAIQANVSVGVVPDGGQPFGTPGTTQGDPRFGDIRIGAQPMSPEVYAISIPHDPYLSGTWAGDILLNSNYDFTHTRCALFGVLIHELGHTFGLPETPGDGSTLGGGGAQAQLSAEDLANLRALYGPRLPDGNEGRLGNDTFRTATRLRYSGDRPFDGTTPLVAYGDVTTTADTDYFAVRTPSGLLGPMTFRLQTAGISLLAPQLTVFDASGTPLGQAQSVNAGGDTVTITLGQFEANKVYYVKVSGATANAFGIGRYGLAVCFDGTLQYDSARIGQVLRGPFDTRPASEIDEIFRNPEEAVFHADYQDHDRFAKALRLESPAGYPANQFFEVLDNVEDRKSSYYRIQAPATAAASVVLTAAVNAASVRGLAGRVLVFDQARNPVPVDVLVNDSGTYTIQAANLHPGEEYYLKVSAPPGSEHGGNYGLVVDFRLPAEISREFVSASLTPAASELTGTLFIAQTQLFHFALSSAATSDSLGVGVAMTIRDRNGAVVTTLTTRVGETASGDSVLLTPGEYSVTFAAISPTGRFPEGLTFQLRGASLTDPIGPAINDPTLAPMYTVPNDPWNYYYPGGVVTVDAFYWLIHGV